MKRIRKLKGAARYNWDGQTLTLPELIAQAKGKAIAFMHGMGTGKGTKPSYHINMAGSEDDVSTGFSVTFNQWYNADLPDESTSYQKKTFVAWSKGQDPNAGVVRPEVSDEEYREALDKVKANRGKPVIPENPFVGRW